MKKIIKTRNDLLRMVRMYHCGFTMKEIADRFNCTPSDISKIIDHLHEEGIIVCNRHLSWSINEIDRIKALYNNGVPLCDIALSVNRSKDAVKTKLLHIRKVENVLKKNKERGKQ